MVSSGNINFNKLNDDEVEIMERAIVTYEIQRKELGVNFFRMEFTF